VRLRLTLLYGVLFLLSGAALLGITYLLVAQEPPLPSGGISAIVLPPGTAPPAGTVPQPGSPQVNQGQMQVGRERNNVLRAFLIQSCISLAIMTVASIGLGWLMAGRVLRPLRTITTAARTISASNLDQRLALGGPNDELKELGDTFDALLGRLNASFDAQRQFAANASHELRTPLTRARTLLEVALSDPQPTIEGLQKACKRTLLAGQQQERLIEALLTLARSERGIDHGEPVDLRAITREALLEVQPLSHSRGLRVDAALDHAPAWGDPRLVERMVTNLVDNAVRHNVREGHIEITTTTRNGRATLCVANSGPLIEPHEVARLLRPFQRLAPDRTAARDGHGLGLAIVHAIATTHDAHLSARPRPGGGLTVEITFPEPAQQSAGTHTVRVPGDLELNPR
jgi:signal transduction histidine kinase